MLQRAALSHLIRNQNEKNNRSLEISQHWLNENTEALKLPSPAMQVSNLISWIGAAVDQDGTAIEEVSGAIIASVGFFDRKKANAIFDETIQAGLIRGSIFHPLSMHFYDDIEFSPKLESLFLNVDLTLKGWELYEKEKRGKLAGNYGFIAMKFGDPTLDPLVRDVLKP